MKPEPTGATDSRRTSIVVMLTAVFVIIFSIASLSIYSVYLHQRDTVISKLGQIEAQQTAKLIFEHLYSVMRKGWTRDEINDIIHHIRQHLPDYEIAIIRGESVSRQFGEVPGDEVRRKTDPLVMQVLNERKGIFSEAKDGLRYGFPVIMGEECAGCHTAAKAGEINGVIVVAIPDARLREPIETAMRPTVLLFGVLMVLIFGTIFVIVRWRVVDPIAEVSHQVGNLSELSGSLTRIGVRLGWPREIVTLAQNFNALMDKVDTNRIALEELSLRDALTGLYNRRHFDAVLSQAIADVESGAAGFSVLLLDLDHFKPINDRYGHAAGDAVLVAVAASIHGTLRDTDVAARVGGDEFAVIALASDAATVAELKERLRTAIGGLSLRFGKDTINPECSIGSATCPGDGRSAEELTHASDVAMYADKQLRRRADDPVRS
jgi:diguanylate cyclase (GGDEF)-like protein